MRSKNRLFFCLLFILLTVKSIAQVNRYAVRKYTIADSLHGSLRFERTCFDARHYDLHLDIDVITHRIKGYSDMRFIVLNNTKDLQIDLGYNFQIDSMILDGHTCLYKRLYNAIFVTTHDTLTKGSTHSLKCIYRGLPVTAINPPWNGGFVWQKDLNGKDWLGVACQLNGASLWWPCKDHPSDEPEEGVDMFYTVPNPFLAVGNGNLISTKAVPDNKTEFHWRVLNPINLYDVTLNMADYAHIKDYYISFSGDTLPINYYILKGNEYRAKEHFQQVKTMLACFEKYFGLYPFYKDGYKLVESSYWGMEHQSCVAYGNNYKNNKFGFDFIIIHESAHEWWGNNLSAADNADDWLHESFATYAEALYVECMNGPERSLEYLKSQAWMIKDSVPIIGPKGVFFDAYDNDQYFKGSWMLHTFRNVLYNDSLFFGLLHHLQSTFGKKTTDSKAVLSYINQYTHNDFTAFFNQYLNQAALPVFQYSLKQKGHNLTIKYRWKAADSSFTMPLAVSSEIKNSADNDHGVFVHYMYNYKRIVATTQWQTCVISGLKKKDFKIDTDHFLIKTEDLTK